MVPLIRTGRLPGPPGPLGRLPHRSVQRLQEVSSFFFFIYPSIHIRVFLMASDRCLELQTVFGSFIQELTRPHQHGSFTTLRRTLGPASSSSSAALRDVLMTSPPMTSHPPVVHVAAAQYSQVDSGGRRFSTHLCLCWFHPQKNYFLHVSLRRRKQRGEAPHRAAWNHDFLPQRH